MLNMLLEKAMAVEEPCTGNKISAEDRRWNLGSREGRFAVISCMYGGDFSCVVLALEPFVGNEEILFIWTLVIEKGLMEEVEKNVV